MAGRVIAGLNSFANACFVNILSELFVFGCVCVIENENVSGGTICLWIDRTVLIFKIHTLYGIWIFILHDSSGSFSRNTNYAGFYFCII